MVLDVLLEANVSNAYLDAGVEILNGTSFGAGGAPRRALSQAVGRAGTERFLFAAGLV
jgi:hypothetical protein